MYTTITKPIALALCSVFFLLPACTKSIQKTLPPTAPTLEHSLPSPKIEPPKKTTDDNWDVSDVDIQDFDFTKKHVAFTFDDAPKRSLEQILAVFADYNGNNPDCKATATIFCNGIYIDNDTALTLHAAWTLGFELGNHTQTHRDLTTLSNNVLQTEISATDNLLQKIDGKEQHLLRTPFGKTNDTVKAIAQTPIINWTIDTLDWTGITAEEIYSEVFSKKTDGCIVLMHDGYPNTVHALKRLLPDLKMAGYQVVSVSKMAKAHGCTLQNGKVYIRARKQ